VFKILVRKSEKNETVQKIESITTSVGSKVRDGITKTISDLKSRNQDNGEEEESSEDEKKMLNVPKQVEEIYTPLVFGIPVTEACKNCGTTSNVPQVVEDCLNYLISREAYKEEGIFRISGIYTQINMLKKMYDKGELVNINDCDEVHTVSGLLKLYYRELPESPFTLSLISPINETDSIESVNDRIEALSTVLSKLSIYNASVLLHLFKFLNLVIQYVNENKMGLSNLGIIFLPALDISQGSFSFLVSNYDLTFSKTIEKIKAKK